MSDQDAPRAARRDGIWRQAVEQTPKARPQVKRKGPPSCQLLTKSKTNGNAEARTAKPISLV